MKTRRTGRRRTAALVIVLALAATSACVREKSAEETRVPLGAAGSAIASGKAAERAGARVAPVMSREGQVALEAGNAAYRRKDYAAAQVEFEKAAKLTPEHAAPWFGIYMVAQARKDNRAADAALAEIRKRTDAPGALPAVIDTAAMNRAHARAGVGAIKP